MFWVIGLHLVVMYHFGSSWLSPHAALFVFNGVAWVFPQTPLLFLALNSLSQPCTASYFPYLVTTVMEHFQHFFCTGRSGCVDAPASGGGPDPSPVHFH